MEFGQRLRRNLKNRGCSWSNWDKTCHQLRSPVDFGQSLRSMTAALPPPPIGINPIPNWDLYPSNLGKRRPMDTLTKMTTTSAPLPLLCCRRDPCQRRVRAPPAPCSSSAVVCNRLKSGLVLHNFLRDLPGVCVILVVPFLARHNLPRKLYKARENLNRKANTPQCTNPPIERNSRR